MTRKGGRRKRDVTGREGGHGKGGREGRRGGSQGRWEGGRERERERSIPNPSLDTFFVIRIFFCFPPV
jgi:hypothetical protein